MPALPWENLDDFLDPDEFGCLVTIHTQGGATIDTVGIFDDPYMNAQLGEYDMDTRKPRVLCSEAVIASVRRGDQVTLSKKDRAGVVTWSATYGALSGPQSTGDGMARLELALV